MIALPSLFFRSSGGLRFVSACKVQLYLIQSKLEGMIYVHMAGIQIPTSKYLRCFSASRFR